MPPKPSGQPANSLRAIRLRLLSALISAITAALIRQLGQGLYAGQIVFFRSFFAVFILVGLFAYRKELRLAISTKRPFGHLARGISGAVSSSTYVGALARLPLADVTVIAYSAPVFTVALAAWVLREKVRVYRWTATIVGFVGIFIMLSSYLDSSALLMSASGIGALLALLSALTSAMSAVQTRRLTHSESTTSIVIYFYSFLALATAFTLPVWWADPTFDQWLGLGVIGLLSAMSQFLTTESYRHAAASVAVFFDYTVIIWAFLIGYVVFGELPGPAIFVGGAIVVGSGIFIVYRERQIRRSSGAGDATTGPA